MIEENTNTTAYHQITKANVMDFIAQTKGQTEIHLPDLIDFDSTGLQAIAALIKNNIKISGLKPEVIDKLALGGVIL